MKLKLILCFLFATSLFAQIKFDANFDSGNLASVTTTDSISYSVKSVEDIGGRWFYFRISGVEDKLIKVTISNSDVNRPMYSYNNTDFIRFSESESPRSNYFEKVFNQDTVFVAYYTPYSYNFLQERLAEWGNSEFVKIDTLGFTEHNFPVQEIVLTDSSVPDENKLRVWIHARTHPGETPSSWHFDGIMQELLKIDETIDYYRRNIIFYLYPFNNPEGVFYGRSRTNYYGVDQERDWNDSDAETSSAVLLLKNRMKQINSEKVISVALNLHSQASPYPTFWIHTASSTSNYFYRREYQFTNLAISDLPYFIKSDYRESNLQNYFPEGFMWSNYGDEILALTYETPYDQYSNGEWVTNENLFQFGATTVYGIGEFLQLSSSERIILDNNSAQASGFWNSSDSGKDFYGNDFYYINSGNGQNTIEFKTENVNKGFYDIYAWWPVNSQNATNTKFLIECDSQTELIEKSQQTNGGQWNLLTRIISTTYSDINVTLSDDANGIVVADAIRIIYRGPIVGVKDNQIAETFELFQNYPNPFNPTTTIKFRLKNAENVKLNIFNSLGQLVETLVNDNLSKGNHEVVFSSNKNNLSSGIYYYQLITDTYSQTKGMILLK